MFDYLIQGLLIIRKYTDDASMVSDDGGLWIAEGLRMEDEDEAEMYENGWLWDESKSAWCFLV